VTDPISTVSKVREYPEDEGNFRTISVSNHWKYDDRVVIEILGDDHGEIKPIVIIADHLHRAIKSATGAHE